MNREGWWGGWLQQSYQAVRDKVDNVHIYVLYVKSVIIKIILTTIIKKFRAFKLPGVNERF